MNLPTLSRYAALSLAGALVAAAVVFGPMPAAHATSAAVPLWLTNVSLGTGTAPGAVAVSPNGSRAYVTNSGTNTVSVVDTASNTVTATITLPTGSAPSSVAITPNGAHAYVTNRLTNTVSIIDTATNAITATITLPSGSEPSAIAITPNGSRAYVTNSGNDTVSVINTASNTISDTVTLPPASNPDPRGVVVSTDGSSAYVADQSTVWTIATATNTRDDGTGVGGGGLRAIAVNPNGSRIYGAASTGNALTILGTGTRVPCTYPYAWSGGAGTLADPYRVTNHSDLDAVSYCRSSAFVQTQNIALTGSWTPIGTTAAPFTGTYHGDGHSISGLLLSTSSVPSGEPVGLFGKAVGADFSGLDINGGQVMVARDNVGLLIGNCEQCEIDSVDVSGTITVFGNNVGGLAGSSVDSTVSRASSSVEVDGQMLTGGLIGIVTDGTVSDSCATGSVTGTISVGGLAGNANTFALLTRTCATGDVIGVQRVGGLVGLLGASDAPTPGNAAAIDRSFATGDVTATDVSFAYAGGLVGMNWSAEFEYATADTFATGSVTGVRSVGGLVGMTSTIDATTHTSYASGMVSGAASNSVGGFVGTDSALDSGNFASDYWNLDTTGRVFGIGGIGPTTTGLNVSSITGLTSRQMGSSSDFAGWDFTSTWGYDCQLSPFPLLRWKFPTATATTCFGTTPTPQATSTTQTSTTSATPSVVSTPSASPPVTGVTHLAPGRARATIDGTPVRVRTTNRARGNGVVVSVGQMSFTLRSSTPRGQRVPTAPNGALVVARAGTMPVTGNGLAPGSQITTTLYSDPIPLGTTTANARGEYSAKPKIPATVPTGVHTLQLTGQTTSGAPFTLDLGVTVATPVAALGARPVITVSPRSAAPGDRLTITATDVQPRCIVDFSLSTNSTRTYSSTHGDAHASLAVPARGHQLKTWVHGKNCGSVHLVQDVRRTR